MLGAGGFIGTHLVSQLKRAGYFVRGVDLKKPEFSSTEADEYLIADLRDPAACRVAVDGSPFSEIYQLAADMGGAGYIFTKENDAGIMYNSALINLHVANECVRLGTKPKLFFASSACVYPTRAQADPRSPHCAESAAYPAEPDSEYGWEKLFSERLFLSFRRNHGLEVKIARFHNVFGPLGAWRGGREKAPAALCRKVAEAKSGGEIEVWGDGRQTRSFLFIDECLEGLERLMRADFPGPVNLGSEEMISLNELAEMIIEISGKKLKIRNVDGPLGVRGRRSDNRLIRERLGWSPSAPLRQGIAKLYAWISAQVEETPRVP